MSIAATDRDSTSTHDLDLKIHARTIYFSLLAAITVLAICSTVAKFVMLAFPAEQYGALNELCKRLYFDFENNIPAWFSTLGLVVSASLFGFIAYCHSVWKKVGFWHWLGLSVLFVGLAIDEATFIHEILIVSLRNKLNLSGIFYFAWVIPGAVFVATVVAIYLPFVWKLPQATRNGLIIAGACFVGGALGMELLGGMIAESQGFDAMSYLIVMTIEESLEMIGVMTLIYVLLRYIASICPNSLRVSVH